MNFLNNNNSVILSAWKPQAIIPKRTQVAHKNYWSDSELVFLVKAFMVLVVFQDKY